MAGGPPRRFLLTLLTLVILVRSVDKEWAGAWEQEFAPRKVLISQPLTRTQGPSWIPWYEGRERQRRQGCLYPGQSRGCPATLLLTEGPADLQALEIAAGIISLETHDLPDGKQRKYDHTHFTEEKVESMIYHRSLSAF